MVRKNIHYAWFILIACCLLQGATLGLVQNSRGLFYAPVSKSLGCSVTQFTLQQVFFSAANIAMLPFANKVLQRKNIRWVLCTALTFFAGATILMGTFTRLGQWYLAAVIQGASGAFLILMPSALLIERWFCSRKGLAYGLSAMTAGVAGIVINIVCADLAAENWRLTYLIVGGISFLMAFPSTAFVIKLDPEDKELGPYQKQSKQNRQIKRREQRTPVRGQLLLLFTVAVMVSACSTYLQHFPNYAGTVGKTVSVGANMTSFAMIGNTIGKLSMGALSDCVGAFKVSVLGVSAIAISFLLLLSKGTSILYVAGLLNGLSLSFSSVQMPLLFSIEYSENGYGQKLSIMMILTNLSSSLGTIGISAIYDIRGTYQDSFIIGFVSMIFVLVMLFWLYGRERVNSQTFKT